MRTDQVVSRRNTLDKSVSAIARTVARRLLFPARVSANEEAIDEGERKKEVGRWLL